MAPITFSHLATRNWNGHAESPKPVHLLSKRASGGTVGGSIVSIIVIFLIIWALIWCCRRRSYGGSAVAVAVAQSSTTTNTVQPVTNVYLMSPTQTGQPVAPPPGVVMPQPVHQGQPYPVHNPPTAQYPIPQKDTYGPPPQYQSK